jgi:hypothetical protein
MVRSTEKSDMSFCDVDSEMLVSSSLRPSEKNKIVQTEIISMSSI